jgi:polysaccharide biosynthesis/export protein
MRLYCISIPARVKNGAMDKRCYKIEESNMRHMALRMKGFMDRVPDENSNAPKKFPAQNHSLKTAWMVALLAALSCAGCRHGPAEPLPEQMAAPRAVTLISGDVVKLTFPGAPELNQSQKIRADGKINLSLIGEVDAAGKTIPTLQSELARLYKPQLQSTTVVVTLESSVTQVVVSGAVAAPRKLVFERPTTIFQAIMEAGGVNEYGSLRNVHLIRLINGEQHSQVLDLRPTVGGKTTRAYYCKDGDVIYVPRSVF